MTDVTPALSELHLEWCRLTERVVVMSTAQMYAWEMWRAKGFTVDDMRLVVRWLKWMIKQQRRREESFRFHNFVQDTDRFAEDLSEARAWARVPRMNAGKASVVRASGRSDDIGQRPVRSAADIIAGDKAFAEFRKLKDQL